ncbi:hypothetical protein GCM10027591_17380 [Zhihengliuella somnathii]
MSASSPCSSRHLLPAAPSTYQAPEAPDADAGEAPTEAEQASAGRAQQQSENLEAEVSGESLPDVIPADWSEDFLSQDERKVPVYRITEQSEGESHEYSTEDLPPAEADQFHFARFSGLTRERIQPLLESAPTAGGATLDGVSDFGFEGEGPEWHVSFNSADLPAGAREDFLEHLAAGRLHEAGQIVSEHTGLPEAVVRQVLASFNDGRNG